MDYIHYLSAKQTVDDRALNQRVLTYVDRHMQQAQGKSDESNPVRILEVGAGIGAMCKRLFQRGTFSNRFVEYILVDIKFDVILRAKRNLEQLLGSDAEKFCRMTQNVVNNLMRASVNVSDSASIHHQQASPTTEPDNVRDISTLWLNDNFSVSFEVADALQYARLHAENFDMVIGCAVLDLWDMTASLPVLLSALRPNGIGMYYFAINFDGTTSLSPSTSLGAEFDASIEHDFHQAMGHYTEVLSDGSTLHAMACHTGRRLLPALVSNGARIQCAGGSTWVVHPETDETKASSYSNDETFFLHCIVDFIQESVPTTHLNADTSWWSAFEQYICDRRAQIEKRELSYIAHNIDVCGTR